MTRALARTVAAALAIALCVLSPAHASPVYTARPIEGPFGNDADAVWLIRPRAPIRSVVVFAHGWKSHVAATPDEWVQQFRPWLNHLVAGGSAVVFPRYQLGLGDSAGAARVSSFRRALQIGFARLGRPRVPVVAVGYSFGGSLVFHYAANARAWGLPTPAAVDSVFPSGPVLGAPLPPLPAAVRVLIQVGESDTVAGTGGAEAFRAWLSHHPRSRFRLEVLRSSSSLVASHAAPKSGSPAGQRAFWAPLDVLITAVRRDAQVSAPAPSLTRLGSGANEVWVMRPKGLASGIVVFGHGWSTPIPAGFGAWIAHLRARGQIVVYPRYRAGASDSTTSALNAFRLGIAAAFRDLHDARLPVVAVGKSFGGSAVFNYASEARAWGVPAPRAVLSIFPALPIGTLPPHRPPGSTEIEIFVGDADTTAGTAGANTFLRWLRGGDLRQVTYTVIHSRPGFLADHDSPQRTDRIAQETFWLPLDRLIARARAQRRTTTPR